MQGIVGDNTEQMFILFNNLFYVDEFMIWQTWIESTGRWINIQNSVTAFGWYGQTRKYTQRKD